MLDFLIKGARYPDFKDNQFKTANIGLKDGKIRFIGKEEPRSFKNLAADGKTLSPGFIDIHMHEENFQNEGEKYVIAEAMLQMGVTTAVGGNCGIQRQSIKRFKETIQNLEGSPINYLMLTGYNHKRYEIGLARYQTASDMQRTLLKHMLEEELKEGACGISFGIEYDPGITKDEIISVLNSFEDKTLLAAAHYRSSTNRSMTSLEELINIADSIPMKFQISHLSSCSAMGSMDKALEILDKAMKENSSLDFDTYPYNAFSTELGSEVFEPGCLKRWKKDYDCILLTQEPYKNVRCTEKIFKEAREKYPDMLAVVFAMNEEEIRKAVACKRGMIASDGILNGGKGHPRAAGTFPRVLGKYVREGKALSLIDALEKMTLKPAKRLSLDKKGEIALGKDADIVIFDAEKISDRADFMENNVAPDGIEYVFVNGQIAVKGKNIINDRLGKFLG